MKIHAPQGDTLRVLRCLGTEPKTQSDIQREAKVTYATIRGIGLALQDFGFAKREGSHGRDWTATPLGLEVIDQYHEDKGTMIEFQLPGAAWDFYEGGELAQVPTVVRRTKYGKGYSILLRASWSDAKWLAHQIGCDGEVQSSSGVDPEDRPTGQALLKAQQRILDALKVGEQTDE